MLTLMLIWHCSDFLTLSNIRVTSKSHPERKIVFTQTVKLQGRIFKLNPCNASVKARTTSLTFVRKQP